MFFFSQPVLAENFDLIATEDNINTESIIIDQNNSGSPEDLILIITPEENTSSTETPSTTITVTVEEEETETFLLEEPITNQLQFTNEETTESPLSTTTIKLQIATYAGDLYNDNFTVTACAPNENSTSTSLTTYCALQQIASSSAWNIQFSDYGGSKFLSSINEFNGSDFNWWAFFHNYIFASEALNQYNLNENENILLSYGTFPMKLEISSTTPELNTTTTILVKEFGFDASWNSAWLDSASSTIIINDKEFFAPDGKFDLLITTTTPYSIQAKKTNLIDSEKIFVYPVNTISETNGNNNSGGNSETTESGNITNTNTNTPNLVADTILKQTAQKILDYLKSVQSEDGKIMDGRITDWAIMSFGANNQYAEEIKNTDASLLDYEKKYNLDDPSDLNSCATYPRHILALLAAGVKKDDQAILGLKEKIYNVCYKNNIYGLNGINDDIFALISLLVLDTNTNEPIINDLVSTIKLDQTSEGGFTWAGYPGVDITGGAINSLQYALQKGIEIDNEIFSQAKNYLKSNQLNDGGWGYSTSDVMTTSWVLMGLNSLGETQNNWLKGEKNPWNVLVENLKPEGFYESAWAPGTIDWFAMQHAVPALLGKSWPIILEPKVENFSSGASFTYGSQSDEIILPIIEVATTTPTSTVVTTTLEMISTTIEIIVPTTTSITSIQKVDVTTSTTKEILDFKFQISNYNTTEDESPEPQSSILNPQSEILPSTTSTTPISPAKIAFATSASAAGGIGLFLAWRLLQTLL